MSRKRSNAISWSAIGQILGFSVLLILLLPLIYVIWISFTPAELLQPPLARWSLRWYQLFFTSPQWTQGLVNSFWIAIMTVIGSLLTGGGVAIAVTRYRFRGNRLLASAVLLPLFVPAVVLAMAILPFVHVLGLWGTRISLAAAHSLWSMPVAFLVIRSALAELDPDLENAARGLGANAIATFQRVMLPLIAPALIVGAIMAFIISLNEFVMALFLSTPAIETLPKVIWPNLRYTLTPLVAAASSVTMVLTLLGLAIALRFVQIGQLSNRAKNNAKPRSSSKSEV